ncbi:MAG: phospho-N-acetylmuramoyl-pentapeptide-transferase [Clostridia bacterium]|nr:phospho-N-acetylmuramoyl-pentapeptide-transferase [Clostridia bacterium]
MREYLYPVLMAGLSFLVAVLLAPIVIRKLRELHFGQKILEDGPTWHKGKQNTPTMGGVIFIIAMTLTVLTGLPGMIANGDYRPLVMLGLSLVFAAVGFVDDWTKIRKKRNQGLTPQQKMLLQIAAAVLFLVVMRVMGYLTPDLYLPFAGKTLRLPWTAYLIFSVIVIIGADNAVNLTDGIDGLCSSVTLIVAVFFSFVFLRDDISASAFSLALAGSLLGFFLFNRHPAKVFMGDTGSLFLGGAVCAMAFAYNMPLILIPVGMVYIIEALSDIVQVGYYKLSHGKRVFKMAPIHHHLELCGWSEWKIVVMACLLTLALCAVSLLA